MIIQLDVLHRTFNWSWFHISRHTWDVSKLSTSGRNVRQAWDWLIRFALHSSTRMSNATDVIELTEHDTASRVDSIRDLFPALDMFLEIYFWHVCPFGSLGTGQGGFRKYQSYTRSFCVVWDIEARCPGSESRKP